MRDEGLLDKKHLHGLACVPFLGGLTLFLDKSGDLGWYWEFIYILDIILRHKKSLTPFHPKTQYIILSISI